MSRMSPDNFGDLKRVQNIGRRRSRYLRTRRMDHRGRPCLTLPYHPRSVGRLKPIHNGAEVFPVSRVELDFPWRPDIGTIRREMTDYSLAR